MARTRDRKTRDFNQVKCIKDEREQKECYKRLYHDRCANNIEKYKVTKKTAKRAVSEAKGRAYEDLYRRLSTK